MGYLQELAGFYRTQLERHRQQSMLRGAMAACALISTVGGEVSFGHRMRIDQIFEALESLSVFDPHEGVALFDEFAKDILAQPRDGTFGAIEALKAAATDPDKAALLIRICLALSEKNGEIGLVEQIEIVTLCTLLDVHPGNCGLYTDPDSTGALAEFLVQNGPAD